MASEEDLNAINENLTGVNEDLEELLQSSNVFSGDLVINSDATLEFAEALGDKVAIVNGNVDITLQTAMDNARIQAVANKFKTITGNLRVRAVAATVAPIQFDSLVGVTDLTIAQKDHFIFPELVSAGTITLGENYESRVESVINFTKLTQLTAFQTATVGSNFALSSIDANTIRFSDITDLKLGSLPHYTNSTLTILGDEGFNLEMGNLKTINPITGDNQAYTLKITGASELSNNGIVLGTVILTDVKTVKLAAFTGNVSIVSGVENLTLGALSNDLSISDNDLETLDITLASKKDITLANCTSLVDAKIAGNADDISIIGASDLTSAAITADADSIVLNNNDDLSTLTTSGAVGSFSLIGCDDIETATLNHTNSLTEKDGRLIITNNNNLTSLVADKVNNLETLTIQGNSDLTTISFDALKADNTGTDASNIAVGGASNGNDLNAIAIVQTSSSAGTFSSGSGISELKEFLDDALTKSSATVKVFFDRAERYTYGTTTADNLVFTNTGDQARLTVVNRTSSSGATKSKRAVVLTTLPGGSTAISINGSTLPIIPSGTAADFVSNLTSTANLTQATNNGVTITANTNGSPNATVQSSVALGTSVVSTTTATRTADAKYITLTVGDFSNKVYLMTTADADFTADPIDGSGSTLDKTAVNEFVIVPGTTTITTVLNALVAEFGWGNNSSPYGASVNTSSASINITAKDLSDAHHGKAVSISSNMTAAELAASGFGSFSVNNAGTTIDDTLLGTDVLITFESIPEGAALSSVGNPPVAPLVGSIQGGTIAITFGSTGTVRELSRNTGSTHDQDDSPSVTRIGAEAQNASSNVDRTAWL